MAGPRLMMKGWRLKVFISAILWVPEAGKHSGYQSKHDYRTSCAMDDAVVTLPFANR
jgi:hypothetical protein